MVETCSEKLTASGFLHSLLQFRRGALAALCYISAAKWKYANSGFTNKAFGMALSARYSLQRIKYFFANSAAAFFKKNPSHYLKHFAWRNGRRFSNFSFPFRSPHHKKIKFCQLTFPFSLDNTENFSKRRTVWGNFLSGSYRKCGK